MLPLRHLKRATELMKQIGEMPLGFLEHKSSNFKGPERRNHKRDLSQADNSSENFTVKLSYDKKNKELSLESTD